MSQHAAPQAAPQTSPEPTGWTGWIGFAAVLLMIGGGLNALYGLLLLLDPNYVFWNANGAVVVNTTTWGWIQMIVGVLVLLCGIGLFSGNMLARTFGVIFAAISLVANFFFIPVFPFWALTIIVIDALIIWAIMVHGREMKSV